jgi:hypothetical protein
VRAIRLLFAAGLLAVSVGCDNKKPEAATDTAPNGVQINKGGRSFPKPPPIPPAEKPN